MIIDNKHLPGGNLVDKINTTMYHMISLRMIRVRGWTTWSQPTSEAATSAAIANLSATTTTIAAKLAVTLAVKSAAIAEDIKTAAAGPIPTQIFRIFRFSVRFSAPWWVHPDSAQTTLTKMYIRLIRVPVYGKTKYLFSKITLQTETKKPGNVHLESKNHHEKRAKRQTCIVTCLSCL